MIRSNTSGKVYIGSAARSFQYRWKLHRTALRKGRHKNQHLQAAWSKYGESTFQFEVLQFVTPDLCIIVEQQFIDKYDAANRERGYNKVATAGSVRGLVHSEETRRKLRLATKRQFKRMTQEQRLQFGKGMRGKKHTPEVIAQMRINNVNRRVSDKTRRRMSRSQKAIADRFKTPEHRAKLRAAWVIRKLRGPSEKEIVGHQRSGERLRGKKRDPDIGRRTGLAQRGRPKSQEVRNKIAAALRGRTLSEETKRKIGVSNKGKVRSEETRNRIKLGWLKRKGLA